MRTYRTMAPQIGGRQEAKNTLDEMGKEGAIHVNFPIKHVATVSYIDEIIKLASERNIHLTLCGLRERGISLAVEASTRHNSNVAIHPL